MKFYDETKPLYIQTNASGIGLGTILLQTRSKASCPKDEVSDNSIFRPVVIAGKSLTGAEKRYSSIKREAPGIL